MKKYDFSDLEKKTCIITGGAGVIGQSICEVLSAAGVNTAVIDIDKEAAISVSNSLSEKYNIKSIGIQADVLDKKSLLDARNLVTEKLGSIDFLINGAGGNSPKATTEMEQILEALFLILDLIGWTSSSVVVREMAHTHSWSLNEHCARYCYRENSRGPTNYTGNSHWHMVY